MLAPFGDRFFRSGQVCPQVPLWSGTATTAGCRWPQCRHTPAVLPSEPARRRFKFPLTAYGSLGREEGGLYFYLLAGKEEKPPQPSCAVQQGWEPRSLVSEPGKVIASLAPIPEKPLIYVSANFEALSNLDKL